MQLGMSAGNDALPCGFKAGSTIEHELRSSPVPTTTITARGLGGACSRGLLSHDIEEAGD